MPIELNTFNMVPAQGQQDQTKGGNVVSWAVSANQVADIVAGQTVRMEDSAGGVPKVIALTANTQLVQGVALLSTKKSSFKANDSLEVALDGTIVYMTAGAAIARGAKVEGVFSTNKVITAAGTNPVLGYAYDKAAADGDLIRVYITVTGQATV